MSRRRWLFVLCAWTYVVWTFRIGTIWEDGDASISSKAARTALALAFTVLASMTLVSAWRCRTSAPVVWVFLAWTVGVWMVRGVQIATADHGVAFVLVHALLGVASIALALLAARASDREPVEIAS